MLNAAVFEPRAEQVDVAGIDPQGLGSSAGSMLRDDRRNSSAREMPGFAPRPAVPAPRRQARSMPQSPRRALSSGTDAFAAAP